MILTIVDNCHTKRAEQYMANRIETTNHHYFSTSPQGCLEVHIYNGLFNRDDSAYVISTFKPVRVLAGKFLDEKSLESEPV